MNTAICAITVTFNPDLEIMQEQLQNLSGRCLSLVVDNGSDPGTRQALESLCEGCGARSLWLPENLGIAAAQNRGMELVEREMPDCEYLLFLDHDSLPDEHFVDSMLAEYRRISQFEPELGILGPVIHEIRTGQDYGFHVMQGWRYRRILPAAMEDDAIHCSTVNSAGTFCSTAVARAVGPMDESLFIDHVETDWCFRAQARGYAVMGTRRHKLAHRMGDHVLQLPLPGLRLQLPYRSPYRHRYLMRNSVQMMRRQHVPLLWKFYCGLKIPLTFLLFGIFSRERLQQLRGISRGIWDGLAGRRGKISVD